MATLPKISETEWAIMKVVWTESPVRFQEILNRLERDNSGREWNAKTVKTLVNRLVRKQALGYRKEGRIHLYYPKVGEGECVAEETDAFLDRVFDGSLKPLVSHIISRKKLTRKQIDDLKRLLDKGGKP